MVMEDVVHIMRHNICTMKLGLTFRTPFNYQNFQVHLLKLNVCFPLRHHSKH